MYKTGSTDGAIAVAAFAIAARAQNDIKRLKAWTDRANPTHW